MKTVFSDSVRNRTLDLLVVAIPRILHDVSCELKTSENRSDELEALMHILCISMEEDDFLRFLLALLAGNSEKINLVGIGRTD